MLALTRKHQLTSLSEFIEIIKDRIRPEEIEQYLPFGVIRKDSGGDGHYQHLILNSIVPIVTSYRMVLNGEPLCLRWSTAYMKPTGQKEICPGCFAIAKSLAFNGGDR